MGPQLMTSTPYHAALGGWPFVVFKEQDKLIAINHCCLKIIMNRRLESIGQLVGVIELPSHPPNAKTGKQSHQGYENQGYKENQTRLEER